MDQDKLERIMQLIREDVPTNNISSGNIKPATELGDDPIVRKKKKKKKYAYLGPRSRKAWMAEGDARADKLANAVRSGITTGTISSTSKVKKLDKIITKIRGIKEGVAAAAPLAPKVIPAIMTGVGAVGTYLQSRKKKEKPEDLLGAVRKAQDKIQQDVANKETVKKSGDFIKKGKEAGKYVVRDPENKFSNK
jgi:hypothetical protein